LVRPFGGCRTRACPASIVGVSPPRYFDVSVALEILVLALTLLAFALFDLYARACERI